MPQPNSVVNCWYNLDFFFSCLCEVQCWCSSHSLPSAMLSHLETHGNISRLTFQCLFAMNHAAPSAPVSQATHFYREGKYSNCTEEWGDFKTCMTAKFLSDEEEAKRATCHPSSSLGSTPTPLPWSPLICLYIPHLLPCISSSRGCGNSFHRQKLPRFRIVRGREKPIRHWLSGISKTRHVSAMTMVIHLIPAKLGRAGAREDLAVN
ncbi:unnamed protein product [Choristocarpus tenellus]